MGSPDTDSGADEKWFITLRDSGLEKNVKICSEQNVNLFEICSGSIKVKILINYSVIIIISIIIAVLKLEQNKIYVRWFLTEQKF